YPAASVREFCSGAYTAFLLGALLSALVSGVLVSRVSRRGLGRQRRENPSAGPEDSADHARTAKHLEGQLSDILSHVPGLVYQIQMDTQGVCSIPYMSPSAHEIFGLDPLDVAADVDLWRRTFHSEDLAEYSHAMSMSLRALGPWNWEGRLRQRDGTYSWFRSGAVPRPREDGSTLWNGIVVNVAEGRSANAALARSRDQLRLITDNLPVLIAYVDSGQRIRFVNKTFANWFALDYPDILGRSAAEIFGPDFLTLRPRFEDALGGEQVTFEASLKRTDGVTRTFQIRHIPREDAFGKIIGFHLLSQDITDLQKSEEKLRQAQKMEAIGQLTGGVAHDFNNLLAVVQGCAELLDATSGKTSMARETILRATERGSELTQRLLAFSRQQPLQPQAVNAQTLLTSMGALLARVLGETVDIQVETGADLWPAQADPGQLENAILNLAINARDAMDGAGRIHIECRNAVLGPEFVAKNPETSEGEYVVVSVTDTGQGMPPDVVARIFEPFFTTKEVGKGTGLGLSMVYGFATQSDGHVAVESEVGVGTTVRLFLPRASEPVRRDVVMPSQFPTGHGESILVIEDAEDFRQLCVTMLRNLGYVVHDVGAAAPAREYLNSGADIDLVLSDVVLPGGESGPEFAADALHAKPDLKVVFMSGYTADAANRVGFLNSVLLHKPFEMRKLATAVREALD
ncbi:MAG: ATP-binding protein, partial [Proteobacteria bacterium]|nr:ATP-binding protein [Pseudomonadota bacterium]